VFLGLPLSKTQEDLHTFFGKYGTVKDVRLVTYRNGHSKGLAYVDFEKEVRVCILNNTTRKKNTWNNFIFSAQIMMIELIKFSLVFQSEASHALLKTDETEIDGHTISVAISRPPERKQTSLIAPDIHSLGGKPRDAAP
jgi:RNA recognition motif-containing protein